MKTSRGHCSRHSYKYRPGHRYHIYTRSISQGRKAGIISVLGIGTGCLFHIAFAAFGLSVVLPRSVLAFNIIRTAGGLYLLILGILIILSRKKQTHDGRFNNSKRNPWQIYRQGIFNNLLNPKVALFSFFFFLNLLLLLLQTPPLVSYAGLHYYGHRYALLFLYGVFRFFFSKTLQNNSRITKSSDKACGGIFVALGLNLLIRKE